MSVYSGTLTSRSVHPASPVLLTKNGPLASNHSLYLIKLNSRYCYPEGNFGRNQLLDGSISLSPLYPNLTIDLHVRTAASLHQSFLWLHPIQA
ncbi:hypothetical protein N7492_004217 [Penicillium capsulatum]|uniref:Uncharacterized protein n=2 Tax=Penicillium TaxID=5073 RepID=A0A9W9LPZ8_9EURO|nr:uncharacterized protein N7539_008465 [Penicillium diatomitis]KAJ5171599.1 hypothetical protein N7492_004192 [Penicillium capsulatum]KAJ5171604.1 hypothetical protein N7492_004197 [Penicillium capsulatum]KAJ5171608.1 hypothetical protein N7492_004201 [Penicillium capsulatum]KAJ5171612.1 hypothetical protein N7492_004205 [Penicillium capsulatum]KAJ5171616.1 hypothetical protein N7492_004209 [Penicillium capsulatum]